MDSLQNDYQTTILSQYIPASWERKKDVNVLSAPFCFTLKSVEVSSGGALDGELKLYKFSLQLYDVINRLFFGSKWSMISQVPAFDRNGKAVITLNQNIYFHTYKDRNIILVLELLTERSSAGITSWNSTAWGICRIHDADHPLPDLLSRTLQDYHPVKMWCGSSRALLFMDADIEGNKFLAELVGVSANCCLCSHDKFNSCCDLIPGNILISGSNQVVGGLAPGSPDCFYTAQLIPAQRFVLQDLTVKFQNGISGFEERLLKCVVDQGAVNFDHGFLNTAPKNWVILERKLQIGVHNGWTYTDGLDEVLLSDDVSTTKTKKQKRASLVPADQKVTSDNTLYAVENIDVMIPDDAGCALVFMLMYKLGIKQNDNKVAALNQSTVTINWGFIKPFNSSWNEVAEVEISLTLKSGPCLIPDFLMTRRHVINAGRDVIKLAAVFKPKEARQGTRGVLSDVSNVIEGPGMDGKQRNVIRAPGEHISSGITEDVIQAIHSQHEESAPTASRRHSKPGYQVIQQQSGKPQVNADDDMMISSNKFNQLYYTEQQAPYQGSGGTNNMQLIEYDIASNRNMFPMPHHAQLMWYSHLLASLPNLAGIQPILYGNQTMLPKSSGEPAEFLTSSMSKVPSYMLATPSVVTCQFSRAKGLSRVAYAHLYQAGFQSFTDRAGELPEVIVPMEQSGIGFNLKLEEDDMYTCNEIVFQFLAFSKHPRMDFLKTVICSFQFYRFPEFMTERLSLCTPIDGLNQGSLSVPCILKKLEKNDQLTNGAPGFVVTYNIDPNFLKPGEGRVFMEYLRQQILHVDIWDGNSLILIGSCSIDLKHLCRQGRPAVQVTFEADVLPSYVMNDAYNLTADLTAPGNMRAPGVTQSNISAGQLHLRMINIGYNTNDSEHNLQTIYVTPSKKHMVTSDTGKFNGGCLGHVNLTLSKSMSNLNGTSQHVVKACHVAQVDRELATLLNTRHGSNEDGDSGGDMERRRKLLRMEVVRKCHPELGTADPQMLHITAYREDKASKLRDLKTIDMYRTKSKHENILHMLSTANRCEHVLYPAFGSTDFFEYQLKNPYNHEIIVSIDIDRSNDPRRALRVIADPREVRILKLAFNVNTVTIDDLIQSSRNSVEGTGELGESQKEENYCVFMKPKEELFIPFTYSEYHAIPTFSSKKLIKTATKRSLSASFDQTNKSLDNTDMDRSILVNFIPNNNAAAISQLEVTISPQPPIIDQTFRFHHPEDCFMKKAIRVPPYELPGAEHQTSQQLFTRCSDPGIICDSYPAPAGEPHDVFLKVACGPSPKEQRFLVAVYLDPYQLRPAQVWQFFVHSQSRVDIATTQGQRHQLSLMLKGGSSTRQVRAFSSHPDELVVRPAEPFVMSSNAVHEITLFLTPLKSGVRSFHVHVVDVEFHQLIKSWIVCTQCALPDVGKVFDLSLPVGGGAGSNKRVSYSNPYSYTKKVRLSTDRDDLVDFKDRELVVGAGEQAAIGLRFLPCFVSGLQRLYIFIADEDGKNEESFAVNVTYS